MKSVTDTPARNRSMTCVYSIALTGALAFLASAAAAASVSQTAKIAEPASSPFLEWQRGNVPRFHFAPQRNWMNDPNGLVFFEGEYHLFYQYNPLGDLWGHMSWGHAVSRDLVHWRSLGVAIPETDVMAFSGSAVADIDNTSRFGRAGKSPLVAIYTGASRTERNQAQHLAYSLDNGRTWTLYEGNPVLDLHLSDFRDPKVFWHAPTRRWIMVVAHAGEHQIGIYSSADLKTWSAESKFGPAGATGGAWECPDLFELSVEGSPGETRWVMLVSLNQNPGHSGAQYFVGQFDGKRFVSDSSSTVGARWLDAGPDFYAPQSWSNIPASDGRRLIIGWAANWRYAAAMPTYPSRGAMTLPRSLSLVRSGGTLSIRQEPVAEIRSLRLKGKSAAGIVLGASPVDLSRYGIHGSAFEWDMELVPGAARQILFNAMDKAGHQTLIGVNPQTNEVFVDRTRSGPLVHDSFASRDVLQRSRKGGAIRLHLFVDRSVLELFVDDGVDTITERFFPSDGDLNWTVQAIDGGAQIARLESWPLDLNTSARSVSSRSAICRAMTSDAHC